MMKSELISALRDVSTTAMVKRGDEYVVQGKWAIITPLQGDFWDVWLCNPKDMAKGLGSRKINNILKMFPTERVQRIWTGEALLHLKTGEILGNLKLLGVRRRRHVSEAQLERLRGNLER